MKSNNTLLKLHTNANPYPYRKQECCICHKSFYGYGNNPAPIANGGRCCDDCNRKVVMPTRLYYHALGLSPRG